MLGASESRHWDWLRRDSRDTTSSQRSANRSQRSDLGGSSRGTIAKVVLLPGHTFRPSAEEQEEAARTPRNPSWLTCSRGLQSRSAHADHFAIPRLRRIGADQKALKRGEGRIPAGPVRPALE